MASRKNPTPFKYRGKWRAQVTLANGQRPTKDFEKLQEAKQWICDTLANFNSDKLPQLGGPTRATLAQALEFYAHQITIVKGGGTSDKP